jgi:hypothetical protein
VRLLSAARREGTLEEGQEQAELQRHAHLRFMCRPRRADRRRALLSPILSLAVQWAVFP